MGRVKNKKCDDQGWFAWLSNKFRQSLPPELMNFDPGLNAIDRAVVYTAWLTQHSHGALDGMKAFLVAVMGFVLNIFTKIDEFGFSELTKAFFALAMLIPLSSFITCNSLP